MKNQFYSSTITIFLNSKLDYKLMFLHVLSGLLNNCKKTFLLLAETTGEILQTT